MEVRLDQGALKNPEVNGGAGGLVHPTCTDNNNGGVVNRESTIILERLADLKGVNPM